MKDGLSRAANNDRTMGIKSSKEERTGFEP